MPLMPMARCPRLPPGGRSTAGVAGQWGGLPARDRQKPPMWPSDSGRCAGRQRRRGWEARGGGHAPTAAPMTSVRMDMVCAWVVTEVLIDYERKTLRST